MLVTCIKTLAPPPSAECLQNRHQPSLNTINVMSSIHPPRGRKGIKTLTLEQRGAIIIVCYSQNLTFPKISSRVNVRNTQCGIIYHEGQTCAQGKEKSLDRKYILIAQQIEERTQSKEQESALLQERSSRRNVGVVLVLSYARAR